MRLIPGPLWGAAWLALCVVVPGLAVADDCAWLATRLQQRFSLEYPVRVEGCRAASAGIEHGIIEQARFDGGATLHLVIRRQGRRAPLTVRVWSEVPVWVAARDLAAGTELNAADVRSGKALLPLADALSPRPELTRVWRLARRIPRGEPILAGDLRSGNEIATGDVCEISFQRGAVRVRTRAIVRQVLSRGQALMLESLDTHRRFRVSQASGITIVDCGGGTG